jgi:hypothetical protein
VLKRLLRILRPRRAPAPQRQRRAARVRHAQPAPWGPASGPVLVSYAVWPDRLLDIDPAQVRREGAAIDRAMFAKVLQAARPYLPELR